MFERIVDWWNRPPSYPDVAFATALRQLENDHRLAKMALPTLQEADKAIYAALGDGTKKTDLVIGINPADDTVLPFVASLLRDRPEKTLMYNGVTFEFDHSLPYGKLDVRVKSEATPSLPTTQQEHDT